MVRDLLQHIKKGTVAAKRVALLHIHATISAKCEVISSDKFLSFTLQMELSCPF